MHTCINTAYNTSIGDLLDAIFECLFQNQVNSSKASYNII